MNLELKHIALLLGIVHGVVVQEATKTFSEEIVLKISLSWSDFIGNKKSIALDSLSAYSTSASAKAEPHSSHQ